MPHVDHSDLRAAAQAATPGPWGVYRQRIGWNWHIGKGPKGGGMTIAEASAHPGPKGEDRSGNATYIALASPDRILRLLDDNKELRAALLDAYNAMDAATRESQTAGIRTIEEADRHIRWFDALLDAQVRAGQALGMLSGRAALEEKPAPV